MKKDINILIDMYRNINKWMVAKDVDSLSSIINKESVLVHMTGYIQPVSEWFEQILSEEMKYYSWEEESVEVTELNEDSAILIGKSKVRASIWGGGAYTWSLQIKMYFKKENGDWVIIKQVASMY
ncbi:MAG: nuclear transport factor 2 family protein [Gemella sp.]|nr:nuclear transport factor 2 family protein [Gemella sp.]